MDFSLVFSSDFRIAKSTSRLALGLFTACVKTRPLNSSCGSPWDPRQKQHCKFWQNTVFARWMLLLAPVSASGYIIQCSKTYIYTYIMQQELCAEVKPCSSRYREMKIAPDTTATRSNCCLNRLSRYKFQCKF